MNEIKSKVLITRILVLCLILFAVIVSMYLNWSKIPDINTSVRFVAMADCRGEDGGINTKIVTKTLENIKKMTPQPSFIVLPGDLIEGADNYSAMKIQLQNFKDTIIKFYPLNFYYPGFGNHEAIAGQEGEQVFEQIFDTINGKFLEGYHHTVYYFDKGDTRFYILNTNHAEEQHLISDTQLDWIKANTDKNKEHTIYFFHEPAYPTGAHVGSSLDANRLQRDKLWEIIDNSVDPIVFCGHEHNYSRRHINSAFNEIIDSTSIKYDQSIFQVTVGSFGAPLNDIYTEKKNVDIPPIAEYHFAVVDIEDTIKVTVYNLEDDIIDSFEQ